jgi:hypothetical protein
MPIESLALASFILTSAKFGYDAIKALSDHNSTKKTKAASRKLYFALCATTDYLDRTKNLARNRDPEIERRLDKIWRDTAHALEPIKPGLAERLYLKAEYWRNPDRFGKSKTAKSELDDAKIKLKDIRSEILNFL